MSDNVALSAPVGSGDTVAADDIGGVKHQRVKVEFGADGSATDVSASDPLPVVQTGTHTVTGAGGTFPVTDSGGSLTVDGTFWQATQPVSLASLPSHDVTNAGTFAVQAAQSGTWNVANISGTVSLPTGASTSAKQDDQSTLLTAIGSLLSGTLTVSVSALPSGLATSAKQDAGNTSLSSIDGKVPALGQALAAASVPVVLTASQLTTLTPPAAITGFATSAKQDTGNSSLSSIDGKLPSLGQALAAASVPVVLTAAQLSTLTPLATITAVTSITNPVAVTGTFWQATQPVSGTVTANAGSGTFTISGAVTQSGTWNVGTVTTVSTVAAVTTVSTVTSLSQWAGNAIDTNSGVKSAGTLRVVLATDQPQLTNALKVDGSAVTQPVSIAAAVAVTDNSGSLTVDAPVGTPVFVRLSDGSAAITTLAVSLASVPSHAVTNAGTFAVQAAQSGTWDVGTVTTVTTCSTLTGSGVAHDGVDSGNPHKVGAKATTSLAGLTLVADADRTNLFAGVDGAQIVRPHCNLEDIVSGNASNTDGTSTQCIAAQAAGVKTYLTTVVLTNTSSSNIYVEIKDGSTVKLTIPLPANGGAVVNLPVPVPGTAATAWNFDPSTSASTVYCSMLGFKSKV